MKILLLSCSTGEGHNHCASAVRESLDARGHETEFLDMLRVFGEPGVLNIEKLLNTISSKSPDMFGLMYKAGEMYSSTNITSPVYLANIRHAGQLRELIEKRGYDAVVCSHLFPMETLTFLRRHDRLNVRCYGVLSDYACIPFLPETDLDGYFLPHADVSAECVAAGMDEAKLIVTGMPVASSFRAHPGKSEARAALGLPDGKKLYLIMTGGIGCGDAVSLCDSILRVPDEKTLICVLAGKNQELLDALNEKYGGSGSVRALPFTDKVALYMSAADVLLSKAGGISSSEAAVFNIPLVHTMSIPGIETLNAEFFAAHGMSFHAENQSEAARFADRLIYDSDVCTRMLAAQRKAVPPTGAEQIAAYIEGDGGTRIRGNAGLRP